MSHRIFAHRRADAAGHAAPMAAPKGESDAAARLATRSVRADAIANRAVTIEATRIG
jgi:hypothetical protein